jgi:hypothetical protein
MEEKLWHDIKEEPKKNGDILLTDGDRAVLESYSVLGIVYDRRDRCKEWRFESRYWKRWCYVEDILRIK